MYKTNPTNKQINLINKYIILGYSLNDIADRVLFNKIADQNPIIYDDVEQIYNQNKNKSIYQNNNKTLIELLEDKYTNQKFYKYYKKYYEFKIIPKLNDALQIAKRLKIKVENIKW